jgi:uncharacterized protein (TIGR03437 family)
LTTCHPDVRGPAGKGAVRACVYSIAFGRPRHPVGYCADEIAFGGVTAAAAFPGLTPGEAGLYQINLTTPPGVPTGQVPLTISAGAASSSISIYMAIR